MNNMEKAYEYLAKKYENQDIVMLELNMPAYAAESAQDYAAFEAIDKIMDELHESTGFLTGVNAMYIMASKHDIMAVKTRFDIPELVGYTEIHAIKIRNHKVTNIA